MADQTINSIEQAVESMRQLTDQGRPFSVEFVKLSGAVTYIDKAALRHKDNRSNKTKHLLNFTNLENQEKRSCFILWLLSVNDVKIKLRS